MGGFEWAGFLYRRHLACMVLYFVLFQCKMQARRLRYGKRPFDSAILAPIPKILQSLNPTLSAPSFFL